MLLRQFIVLISFLAVAVTAILSPSEDMSLINGLLRNYDGNIRPQGKNRTESGSHPTTVFVNMFTRSIRSVDDLNKAMETQITFRMQWLDERLKFNRDDVKYLTVTPALGQKLWKPDLFFSNEIEYRKHDGIAPNEYYRIFPNGDVLFSSRISLKLSCPMIFKLYPFDGQTCSVRMASYGYTTEEIIFKWKPVNPVQVTMDLHMPVFSLKGFTTDYCDSITITGTYSCLRVDLAFDREISTWVSGVFVPMTIGILIIWFSTWISPADNAIVRALLLGAGAFYCKWSSTPTFSDPLPPVSYTTAFDAWCFMMNIFILVAIIQFVVVVRLSQRRKVEEFNAVQANDCWARLSNGIDIVMRIIYLLALLGIILLYYFSYRRKSQELEDSE